MACARKTFWPSSEERLSDLPLKKDFLTFLWSRTYNSIWEMPSPNSEERNILISKTWSRVWMNRPSCVPRFTTLISSYFFWLSHFPHRSNSLHETYHKSKCEGVCAREGSELATVRDSLHEDNRNWVCVRDEDGNRKAGKKEGEGKRDGSYSI